MLELFDGFLVVDVDAVGVVPVLDEPLAYWVRDSEESYRLVVCAVENCREVHCSLLPGFYFDSSYRVVRHDAADQFPVLGEFCSRNVVHDESSVEELQQCSI